MIDRWPIDGSLPPRMSDEQLDQLLAEIESSGCHPRPLQDPEFKSPLNGIRQHMEDRNLPPERLRRAAERVGPDHPFYELALAEFDAQVVVRRLDAARDEDLPW